MHQNVWRNKDRHYAGEAFVRSNRSVTALLRQGSDALDSEQDADELFGHVVDKASEAFADGITIACPQECH